MDNDIVSKLIQSYEDVGIINPVDGVHYPPKQHMSNILEHIKEVLFPGFFGVDALKGQGLEGLISQRLDVLKEDLEAEIFKCVHWNPEDKDFVGEEAEARRKSVDVVRDFLNYLPELREWLRDDAVAMYNGDPAAKSLIEVILCFPGFQAIMVYRIAHFFHQKYIPLIPRMMAEIVHFQTGIDIHPGAKIGRHFCIDHGSGIVIGETAVLGEYVKLYQGVTLGAFSVSKDQSDSKRHPTLEDYVTVYAMVTILGGDTVVGKGAVVGGNVWLTRSIPAGSKIYLSEDFDSTYKLIQAEES